MFYRLSPVLVSEPLGEISDGVAPWMRVAGAGSTVYLFTASVISEIVLRQFFLVSGAQNFKNTSSENSVLEIVSD